MPEMQSFTLPEAAIYSPETDVYRTAISMPIGSQYEEYYFSHPTSLITVSGGCVIVKYRDNFIFELIKKNPRHERKHRRLKMKAKDVVSHFTSAADLSQVKTKDNSKEKNEI